MQRVEVYYKPSKLDDAVQLLSHHPGAKVLAGGTDLIIQLNEWTVSPACLIDIGAIPELTGIRENNDSVVIGSMTRFADIASNAMIRENFRALSEAAGQVAAPQVRNRATIGGNVANGAVAADSVPALMALGATAELVSVDGTRYVPISELMLDLNKTAIRENEILSGIVLPKTKRISAFQKIGRRKAQAISRICLAVSLEMDESIVTDVQVAVGAAGRTAYLCPSVSEVLEGKPLNESTIEKACQAVEKKVREVLGARSTATYKSLIASASLERALLSLKDGEIYG